MTLFWKNSFIVFYLHLHHRLPRLPFFLKILRKGEIFNIVQQIKVWWLSPFLVLFADAWGQGVTNGAATAGWAGKAFWLPGTGREIENHFPVLREIWGLYSRESRETTGILAHPCATGSIGVVKGSTRDAPLSLSGSKARFVIVSGCKITFSPVNIWHGKSATLEEKSYHKRSSDIRISSMWGRLFTKEKEKKKNCLRSTKISISALTSILQETKSKVDKEKWDGNEGEGENEKGEGEWRRLVCHWKGSNNFSCKHQLSDHLRKNFQAFQKSLFTPFPPVSCAL